MKKYCLKRLRWGFTHRASSNFHVRRSLQIIYPCYWTVTYRLFATVRTKIHDDWDTKIVCKKNCPLPKKTLSFSTLNKIWIMTELAERFTWQVVTGEWRLCINTLTYNYTLYTRQNTQLVASVTQFRRHVAALRFTIAIKRLKLLHSFVSKLCYIIMQVIICSKNCN